LVGNGCFYHIAQPNYAKKFVGYELQWSTKATETTLRVGLHASQMGKAPTNPSNKTKYEQPIVLPRSAKEKVVHQYRLKKEELHFQPILVDNPISGDYSILEKLIHVIF